MKRREFIIPSDILQRTRRTARGYYKSSSADEAAIIRISLACPGPKGLGQATCLIQIKVPAPASDILDSRRFALRVGEDPWYHADTQRCAPVVESN